LARPPPEGRPLGLGNFPPGPLPPGPPPAPSPCPPPAPFPPPCPLAGPPYRHLYLCSCFL